jgi:N-methylhydantoinase A
MARALRAVSTERGQDPRSFALLAFGGNGPIHATTLARLLEMKRILVPPVPGVFSALGMLFPDVEHHYVRTFKRRLDALDGAALAATFKALESEGAAVLREEGFADASHRFERLVDLRYVGANSELTVAFADGAARLRDAFEAAHEQQYGYRSAEETVETMNVRVVARAQSPERQVPDRLSFRDEARASGTRRVYFGPQVGWLNTTICGRMDLDGEWRPGPLLIEEFDSTTVVPPDGRARRIAWDTIEIEIG